MEFINVFFFFDQSWHQICKLWTQPEALIQLDFFSFQRDRREEIEIDQVYWIDRTIYSQELPEVRFVFSISDMSWLCGLYTCIHSSFLMKQLDDVPVFFQ